MLRIADNLPRDGIDAIYVPGLGLTYDKSRLTTLNTASMEEAIKLTKGKTKLVISGCYDGEIMKKELAWRLEIAKRGGIGADSIEKIEGIINTKDELSKLSKVLRRIGAKNVLLISDEYHMPRLVRWSKLILGDIKIFNKSVRPSSYDFVCEPNLVKVIRSGIKPLWILWNVLLYFATPIFVRKPSG